MTAPAPTPTTDPVTGPGSTGGAPTNGPAPTPDPSPAPAPTDLVPTPVAPPSVPPAPAPAPGTPPATDGDKKDDKPTSDPVDWKARARQWEDRAKDNKTAADERDALKLTMQAIAAALDPDGSKDDDPAEVAQRAITERDAKDAELRQLRIEQAAERAARKAGADVDALLDSRGFLRAIEKLDPTADDFKDRLGDAVTAALTANPRLKAATASTAPTRTATDPGGTRDTTGQLTRADLAAMTPEQIVEARRAGRLDSLLKGSTT